MNKKLISIQILGMLAAGFAIPGSLTEAEQLKKVSKHICKQIFELVNKK